MEQQATDKAKQTDEAGATKPLHEKIREAIQKDDDLLSRLLKTLSHPLVMIVGILALLYWYKHQQSVRPNKIKTDSKLTKLKKKNKKLKKRIKQQSLRSNGSGKRSTSTLT